MSHQDTPVAELLLEEKIARLQKEFEDLVDSIENSFINNHVPLEKIQKAAKHIPISLKCDMGDFFRNEQILKTTSMRELFFLLSTYWDYLNPGILSFLVGRFGSDTDVKLFIKYAEKLKQFRASVKLGEYVKAATPTEVNSHKFQKIISIMNPGWENQTLEDAEQYKIDFAKECRMQSFLAQVRVEESSIAIIFYLPPWIEVNMYDLMPFFKRNGVITCHQDSIEKVRSCSES